VTPPADRQAVAESLSNGSFTEFPAMAHWPTGYSPCAHRVIAAFLDNPSAAPATSCVVYMPGPEFVLPRDVRIAPGIYRVTFNIAERSRFEDNLPTGCLLLFVAEIGCLVIAGLGRLVRGREGRMPVDRTAGLAHPLAGLVAVLNVGFTLGLSAMVRSLADTNRLVLRFNAPSEFWPLSVIPVMAAALTPGLMIVAGGAGARPPISPAAGLALAGHTGSGRVQRLDAILGSVDVALLAGVQRYPPETSETCLGLVGSGWEKCLRGQQSCPTPESGMPDGSSTIISSLRKIWEGGPHGSLQSTRQYPQVQPGERDGAG